MANEKFTQLPTVSNAQLTDIICAVQAGISSQETLQQVISLGLSQTILSFAGNPNGSVAGSTYQFCWDTSNSLLYICTTTGSTTTAVWTRVDSGFLSQAVLLNPSGNQTISAHDLTLTAGSYISGSAAGGFAGNIQLYPTAASVGGFRLLNSASSSFTQTLTNSSVGQATTLTLPDPGATTANVLLSRSNSVQHITAGGLQVDASAFVSGLATGGSAGQFTAYSPTASLGTLSMFAADSAGNFSNVLINASTSAARTWTLPDATGTVALTSQIPSGAALTKTDDANVTLTLGGSPTTALVNAASLTLGWTGQLAPSRGGTGISSLGTGVATALGVNVGTAGAFVVNGGALGTPSSGTLTNATGLPIGGITGLGTGVATALAANVTGSGGIALATSPTFVTPVLGVAAATSINFGGSTLSTYTDSTFTPTMTCGSPGDLSVAYANQTGIYVRIGSMVYANVRIQFTPTFITASGQVQIAGLPFAVQVGNGIGWSGSVSFLAGSPTFPIGTTSISIQAESGASFCSLPCLGSAVAGSSLQMSGLATGVQYHLVFSVAYHV